jgi:hypothetical protein
VTCFEIFLYIRILVKEDLQINVWFLCFSHTLLQYPNRVVVGVEGRPSGRISWTKTVGGGSTANMAVETTHRRGIREIHIYLSLKMMHPWKKGTTICWCNKKMSDCYKISLNIDRLQ